MSGLHDKQWCMHHNALHRIDARELHTTVCRSDMYSRHLIYSTDCRLGRMISTAMAAGTSKIMQSKASLSGANFIYWYTNKLTGEIVNAMNYDETSKKPCLILIKPRDITHSTVDTFTARYMRLEGMTTNLSNSYRSHIVSYISIKARQMTLKVIRISEDVTELASLPLKTLDWPEEYLCQIEHPYTSKKPVDASMLNVFSMRVYGRHAIKNSHAIVNFIVRGIKVKKSQYYILTTHKTIPE